MSSESTVGQYGGLSQKIKQQLETVQAVAVVFENVNLRLESEIKINGAGCRVTRYTKG